MGVVPVAPRRVTPIDERDVSVRPSEELIGERESHRAGANHEIVRFQGASARYSVNL